MEDSVSHRRPAGRPTVGRAGLGRPRGEQRRAERKLVLHGATAFQSSPLRRFNCVVRDVSSNGARLVGADIDIISERFVLAIRDDADGTAEPRFCQVVWRRHRMIGVRFIARSAATAGAPRATVPAPTNPFGETIPVSDVSQSTPEEIIATAQTVVERLTDGTRDWPTSDKPVRGLS